MGLITFNPCADTRPSADRHALPLQPIDTSTNLVAQVAHELNNPLDGILRYLNLACRVIDQGETLQAVDYLDHCRQGVNRMIQITGQLLAYTRGIAGQAPSKPIDQVVEEAIRSIQDRATQYGVIITANYRTDASLAIAGPELFQVCVNLFRNALDVMPDGGMLTITVTEVAGYMVLHVEDTGHGLPDCPERLFEPFFTTKGSSGTGLGLAICKDFIERLGGTILAANRRERGAAFTLRIPLSEMSIKPSSAERRPMTGADTP